MYQTIRLSSCVSVQGEFVENLADGRVVIRVGATEYSGQPIPRTQSGRIFRPEVVGLMQVAARRG